jgi:DNA-binding LacI/PurR family transcriptional regulator
MPKHELKHINAEKMIRKAISHCEIGDKIPGERVFAKDLGISYMTARKAVESLVTQGVLYRIPKKGTYVADPKSAQKKTKNIGYFLDSSIEDGLSSPYYSLIFNALEKEATKNGYALIYFSDISESHTEKKMDKIDGAIISCFPRIENIVQDINKQVPVVCIDNNAADISIPSVTIDNSSAVTEAIVYLCSLGHRHIGFITGLDDSDVGKNRLAGYLGALSSCGMGEDANLIFRGDYSYETGEKGASYFLSLDTSPTAIVCANDTMAIGAIREISKKGLKVPGDISIIGFDDISVASQMTPALTTLSAPVPEIAEHSLTLLNAMMNGIDPDNRHITLPAPLVERNTCAAIENSATPTPARKLKQY